MSSVSQFNYGDEVRDRTDPYRVGIVRDIDHALEKYYVHWRTSEPPGWIYMDEVIPWEAEPSAVDRLAKLGRFLPTEADIGRGVVYYPPHGGRPEDGVITSLNDHFVFVRYRTQHPGARGQATRYRDLRWACEHSG